jgi:hypothetical protein
VVAARRALAVDSAFPLAIWTLGLAQAFNNQPDSAVATLQLGVRWHPRDPTLASALVFAYAAEGRWTDAARIRAGLQRQGDDTFDATFADLVFGDPGPLLRLITSAAGRRAFIVQGGVRLRPALRSAVGRCALPQRNARADGGAMPVGATVADTTANPDLTRQGACILDRAPIPRPSVYFVASVWPSRLALTAASA